MGTGNLGQRNGDSGHACVWGLDHGERSERRHTADDRAALSGRAAHGERPRGTPSDRRERRPWEEVDDSGGSAAPNGRPPTTGASAATGERPALSSERPRRPGAEPTAPRATFCRHRQKSQKLADAITALGWQSLGRFGERRPDCVGATRRRPEVVRSDRRSVLPAPRRSADGARRPLSDSTRATLAQRALGVHRATRRPSDPPTERPGARATGARRSRAEPTEFWSFSSSTPKTCRRHKTFWLAKFHGVWRTAPRWRPAPSSAPHGARRVAQHATGAQQRHPAGGAS